MKLLSGPLSMFGAKAQIALGEKGTEFDLEMVPFSLATRYSPIHPDVARINPKGQVPVLLDGAAEIFDSTQIFEYLEDAYPAPPLWPQSVAARAAARQLELKSDEVFFPNVIEVMSDFRNETARAAIRDYYAQMENMLADGRDWLAESYSYADIAFYMASFFAGFLREPMGEDTPALLAWRTRMEARPAVEHVMQPMRRFLTKNGLDPS